MRARALCFLSLACLAWVLVACDLLPVTRSDQLLAEIDKQEHKWLEKDVDSHRIVVSHVRSIWHAQMYDILVSEGRVVEQSASCIPAPAESGECQVESFDPEEYTVAGLFAVARLLAQRDEGDWTEIEFDPTYGYPLSIAYDHPDIVDEDTYWGVRSFEVNE
ncbi:MAG TPA: DUF6174 domain-containing protein [Anaerolineae bacterium]|nr:DUF6174 domain-containing protein [Anaerolineae bacterium]